MTCDIHDKDMKDAHCTCQQDELGALEIAKDELRATVDDYLDNPTIAGMNAVSEEAKRYMEAHFASLA